MATYEYSDLLIVDTLASLPTAARRGQYAHTKDTNRLYYWNGSAWTLVSGSGGSAGTGSYNPDNPGSSDDQDEFNGGAYEKSWSWGNQESSTATLELDGLTLYKPADATGLTTYMTDGPDGSLTDWSMVAKFGTWFHVTASNYSGLALLATGTMATPTLIYATGIAAISTVSENALLQTYADYTAAATTLFNHTNWGDPRRPLPSWVMMTYASSTKELVVSWSQDGRHFRLYGNTTLASHPTTKMGFVNTSYNATYGSVSHFDYIRWFNEVLPVNGTLSGIGV